MANIEQVPIQVVQGYRLELTAAEIKRLREIFYKVAFMEPEARVSRWLELREHASWAHDMMGLCDQFLHDWMEETRQEDKRAKQQR